MIVVDASLVADFLLDAGPRGEWATVRIAEGGALHAPELLDYEVASVVRSRVLRGETPRGRARVAIHDLGEMRITRYPAARFLEQMWTYHPVLSAYDAAYVSLAEALDAPLVTTDARLGRTHGLGAAVVAGPMNP
jgi:predicted nucleic acid-binding protein